MRAIAVDSEESRAAEGGFDVERVRRDFPILREPIHGDKHLAYLDSAATTQKPSVVIEAVAEYYTRANSNVHRALHQLAERATRGYEAVRRQVAEFIHAPGESSIVFTRGTTESINLVAHGWGRRHIGRDDEIVLSVMEHHSNLIPWQLLAREKGAKLRFVPVLEDATLDLDALDNLLGPKTRLVALTHMSNVLGTINPVKDIATRVHACGAKFLVDAAQSVPHMPVDVQDMDCDFLAFSGHKMCGPTGTGVLCAKADALDEMDPFMGGGEMILKVQLEESTWADPPYKFEPGTPNIAGVFGLGAALAYLSEVGLASYQAYEQELTAYALEKLDGMPGLRVHGQAPHRGGVVAFELDGVHPHDVAQFVDREGVAIRAGHHCAQPLMRALGVRAISRASFYLYNTRDEVDQLVDALRKTQEFFSDAT